MRVFSTLILVMCFTFLGALESPLIVRGQGDLTGIINPNSCTIQLYRTAGKSLVQTGSYFFLSDLELIANQPDPASFDMESEFAHTWSVLRMGRNTKPNILNELKAAKNGEKAWKVNMDAENEFWSTIPEYDGKVMGAIGTNHIFLCFPALHALLAYEIKNGKELNLIAIRNIGPDLMIGSVFNSKPEPKELLRQLPKEVQDAFKERTEAKAKAIEDGEIVKIKEPKLWVQPLQNEKIVVLDSANQKLLVYEISSKMLNLKSMRNLEIELMVPPNVSVNTQPDPGDQYNAYVKELSRARISPFTQDELKALSSVSGQFQKDGKDDDIQAFVDERYNLVIDFVKQRKLMLYSPDEGGSGITLFSVRDYTLENAIAIHIDQINQGNKADELYAQAKKIASRPKQEDRAMQYLKLSLKYKPSLVEDAEKGLAKHLSEHKNWPSLIKQGRDDYATQLAQEEARRLAVEEMKKDK